MCFFLSIIPHKVVPASQHSAKSMCNSNASTAAGGVVNRTQDPAGHHKDTHNFCKRYRRTLPKDESGTGGVLEQEESWNRSSPGTGAVYPG